MESEEGFLLLKGGGGGRVEGRWMRRYEERETENWIGLIA